MRTLILVVLRLLKLAHMRDSRFGKWVLEKYYTLSPSYQFWVGVIMIAMIAGYVFL